MKESERETDEQSNRTKVQHYCSVVCRWWWYKNAYGHKSCFELLLNICVNGGAFYLKRFIVAKKISVAISLTAHCTHFGG